MAEAEAQAILGAGAVQLNVYDPATQAYLGWGDELGADKFELTPDSEVKEKTSKKHLNYGQAIASVPLAKPTKIAITISAADKTAMAMQFQGVLASYSQAAGSIAGTVNAKLDKWVALLKRNVVEAGLTFTGATAGLLTKDTDYVVNYATGEVKFLSTGEAAANEVITVAGTANAVSGTRIRGGTQVQVRAQARFVGVNLVDSRPMRAEVWEASLRSTQGFDFLADDFNGIQLEGTCVIPAGKAEPYIVDFDDAPA
ncbi:hypothetical protein [Acidovorax cavernicola]|uniref:Uncharacterized protein n=1 Tax=Acidovorax cavernicola TaxID=1675792 RepID=A0A9X8GVB7_9BURK|nr:hypothetical protein [Acidovorax cavernicola]RIX79119.1 hypothetical protein D3H34_15375 [Acidovorax cavernicola]